MRGRNEPADEEDLPRARIQLWRVQGEDEEQAEKEAKHHGG
jgi:hypothetical protein